MQFSKSMCMRAQLLGCVWQKQKGEKRKREGIKKAGSIYYKAHTLWGICHWTQKPPMASQLQAESCRKRAWLKDQTAGNYPCGLPASTAGSKGLIPDRGTTISHAACHVIQSKKKKKIEINKWLFKKNQTVGRRDKLRHWDWYIHPTIYKIDN